MIQPSRMVRAAGAVAAFATLALAASAADKPTLALVGGQVIDGYEGPPLQDGVVLIAGERIVAVGRRDEITVPPGTRVVDTEGMSVLPGLMDMHVHLMILGHADYEHWELGTLAPAATPTSSRCGATCSPTSTCCSGSTW